jgi:ATP-dependent Clp protease ATP-binding subunit ClpA
MFERFTDDARTLVFAARAKAAIGIDLAEIKRKIEENFGPGALDHIPSGQHRPSGPLTGRITLTRESKLSLALALKHARALHHNYLGTEHLLLGLLATADRPDRDSVPETPGVLRDLGLDAATVRDRVLAELS